MLSTFLMEGNLNKVTDLQLGWLAGIIDGEGSISLNKSFRRGYFQYSPNVTVCNTDRVMLDTIISLTGIGKIYKGGERASGYKKVFRWMICSQSDIAKFLLAIRSCLVVKKERADIVINFCIMVTLDLDVNRDSLYLRMKELNRRGIKKE